MLYIKSSKTIHLGKIVEVANMIIAAAFLNKKKLQIKTRWQQMSSDSSADSKEMPSFLNGDSNQDCFVVVVVFFLFLSLLL